ncbi:MAG: hypothetical protein HFI75_14845 [Lachnospiraceae bacterium]|nr:hypothetical protein [Lachnospiraceae bacterium]
MLESGGVQLPKIPLISAIEYSKTDTEHIITIHFSNVPAEDTYTAEVIDSFGDPVSGTVTASIPGMTVWKVEKSAYTNISQSHQVRIAVSHGTDKLYSDWQPVMMTGFKEVQVVVEREQIRIRYEPPSFLQKLEALQFAFACGEEQHYWFYPLEGFEREIITRMGSIPLPADQDWKLVMTPFVSVLSQGLAFEELVLWNRVPLIRSTQVEKSSKTETVIHLQTEGLAEGTAIVTVLENGQEMYEAEAAIEQNAIIAAFENLLNPGAVNLITVRQKGAHTVGVQSQAKPLVLLAPQIRAAKVANDGSCIIETVNSKETISSTFVEILVNDSDRFQVPIGQLCQFKLEPAILEKPIYIQAAQGNPAALGPYTEKCSLITTSVPITEAENDGEFLTVSRGPLPEDIKGCWLLLYQSSMEYNRYYFTEETIKVRSTDQPDQVSLLLSEQMPNGLQLTGPESSRAEVLTKRLQMDSIIQEEQGVVYRWKAVSGCSYEYKTSSEQQPVPVTEAQCILPGTIQQAGGVFYVRAVRESSRGPWTCIPVEAYRIVEADYNGRQAKIRWECLSGSKSADRFRVEVSEDFQETVAEVWTKEQQVEFMVAGKKLSVLVTAYYGEDGGIKTAKEPLFSHAFYLADHAGSPVLQLLSESDQYEQKEALTAELSLGSLPENYQNEVFYLKQATAPLYTLQLQPAVWEFTQDGRKKVREAYEDLLGQLQTKGISAWDLLQVQNLLGRILPQTMEEQMFYNYGYQKELGCIDLKPGMSVKTEYESRQEALLSDSNQYKTGYLTVANAEYEVTAGQSQTGELVLGMDAFFLAVASQCMDIKNPLGDFQTKQGAGGIADFHAPKMAKAFYRLVLPSELFGQNEDGESLYCWYMTMIASDRYSLLDEAARQLRQGCSITSNQVEGTYIMGRAMMIPCIKIMVDGELCSVPVGTTLGNVLNWKGLVLPAADSQAGSKLRILRTVCCEKYCHKTLDGYRKLEILPAYWNGINEEMSKAWQELPLLQGDEIWIP